MPHFCPSASRNLVGPRRLHCHFPHLPGRTKLAVVPHGGSAQLIDLKTAKGRLFGASGEIGGQREHRIRTDTFTHFHDLKMWDLYEQ